MYDVVFENGVVADTEAKQLKKTNVAIKDGIIAEISTKTMPARRTIDVNGYIVSPGFIDVHSHIDGDEHATQLSCLQGITTYIGGNCGLSVNCIADFFDEIKKRGTMLNIAMMAGHSFTMRGIVGLNDVNAHASHKQVEQMKILARKALNDGAFGVSLGLDYAPGTSLKEIDSMAEITAEFGGVLPVHTRLFTQNDLYSLYELLAAAKKSKVRLQISHFVYQYCGFGTLRPALNIMDDAVANGLDVFIDSGMYSEWATYIGTATFEMQTLADNSIRFADLLAATGIYTGKRLDKNLYQILRANYPDESVICLGGNFDEVASTLKRSYAMPSTDAGIYRKGEGHPQTSGTFARYFEKLVREAGVLELCEAIYKATLLPATVFGIANKGIIKEGYDADITVFDINTIADKSNFPGFGEPDAPPVGIPYVMVNGELCVDECMICHKKPGKILKKLQKK